MAKELSECIDKIAMTKDVGKWYLADVKQINLFIGPNNSGKSRSVRELFNSVNREWLLEKKQISVSMIIKEFKEIIPHRNFLFRNSCYMSHSEIEELNTIVDNFPTQIPIMIDEISDYLLKSEGVNNSRERLQKECIEPIIDKLDPSNIIRNFITPRNSIYIPTLRSLRSIGENDIFSKCTLDDYFVSENKLKPQKSIFTGHSLYNDLQEHLLGSHIQRLKVRKYEEYLSENFFFGEDISLVPRINDSVVYFKEGEKEERPIYDLGDGIQSIIILTFPVFVAEEPTLFYIEEPEHYLHAGLQRTLIETFAKHKEHLFFMTTHSNHCLDLAQELLLANCSIWVEGVTDKLYLRKYMEKYISELIDEGEKSKANKLKSYHENLHYVFTEYQGSNITHWNFEETPTEMESSEDKTPARKITRNILLIADADIDSKSNRVEILSEELGAKFHLLDWKEIENYVPHDILIKTAKTRWDTFNQRGECSIERFSNIEDGKFETKSYGIGTILERYVNKSSETDRKFYETDSGTIKDKVKFCNTAIDVMSDSHNEWSLTPELKILCEKLWNHVIDSN